MPKVPKVASHSIPAKDLAQLEDYRKAYLEGVRQLSIRAQTTKDSTGTLPHMLIKNLMQDESWWISRVS
jgi:hypothetical protein